MKKLLAVLLALLILGVGAAFGETTNKNFKIEGNTLVKYNGPGGEVTVPEGITVLGEWAFEDSGVTKVNLPESLEEIKSYCFFSCDELKEVTTGFCLLPQPSGNQCGRRKYRVCFSGRGSVYRGQENTDVLS